MGNMRIKKRILKDYNWYKNILNTGWVSPHASAYIHKKDLRRMSVHELIRIVNS